MDGLKILEGLGDFGTKLTEYRVIKVRCISGRGTIDSTSGDREAVEFLKNFAFTNPVEKQDGNWKMFKGASAASKNLVFSVFHCSPSVNNSFVDMRIKLSEMKHLESGCPGYFLMTRFDMTVKYAVKVDAGYASYLRYDSKQNLCVFDAFGRDMATWEIFCVPVDHPLPEGYVVLENLI